MLSETASYNISDIHCYSLVSSEMKFYTKFENGVLNLKLGFCVFFSRISLHFVLFENPAVSTALDLWHKTKVCDTFYCHQKSCRVEKY